MREAAAFILLMCTSAAAAVPVQLNPKEGVVLPSTGSKELLHQCSRSAPQGAMGTWHPSAEQIRELEGRLPSALQSVVVQRGSHFAQPVNFRRQYAGFLVGGRKVIYVNAFPSTAGEASPGRSFDWHRSAVIVCDGGTAFFGVEYDPQGKTFSHFEFNGPL